MRLEIMVVDNSRAFLRRMEELLAAMGPEVRTAEDGISALGGLADFTPDIMFIDWVMPNIGGDKLCLKVRDMAGMKDAYLVILSAMVSECGIDFRSFGADACIVKGPFQEMEKNILQVLELASGRKKVETPDAILGVDSVHPRQATRELLRVKKHYEATITNLRDGFLEFMPDRRVIAVNPAAMVFFGMNEKEILSSDLVSLFAPASRQLIEEAVGRLPEESSLVIGEDEPVPVGDRLVTISFFIVDDPWHPSWIAIVSDVTARRKAEIALQEARDRLEDKVRERTARVEELQRECIEAAHQAGMADIATGVLHNVGNILTSVLMTGDALRKQAEQMNLSLLGDINDIFRDHAGALEKFVIEHSDRMKVLLQYLLALEEAQGEERARFIDNVNGLIQGINAINDVIHAQQEYAARKFLEQPVQLSVLVDDAVSLLANTLKKQEVEVVRRYGDVPPVIAQRVKLLHVVVNLMKNSMEAMQETSKGRRITIHVSQAEGQAEIRISDTGCGIRKDLLDKVFLHGFTTKAKGHGFGLHNSILHVREMQGRMWAESEGEGKGATMVVRLPLRHN